MPRYFAEIAYNGTAYHGWQIQENAITVQAKVDEALTIILQQSIITAGCGRTDTGVHAKQFFLHFNSQETIADTPKIIYKLNKLLPKDIVFYNIVKVKENAHARFDAVARTYQYYLTSPKNVFNNLIHYYTEKLHINLMNEAAHLLINYTDFSCFSKSNTQVFTNNCKISKATFEQVNQFDLIFTIQADRFLRNMVRAIVGTLLEVGKEKITLNDFQSILESKNRSEAGASVPACGLFLTKVEYPDHLFI